MPDHLELVEMGDDDVRYCCPLCGSTDVDYTESWRRDHVHIDARCLSCHWAGAWNEPYDEALDA